MHFKIGTPVMALICFTQQTRYVDPTPIQCCFNIYNTGQALAERLVFAVYHAGIHEILSGLSRMSYIFLVPTFKVAYIISLHLCQNSL